MEKSRGERDGGEELRKRMLECGFGGWSTCRRGYDT